MDAGYISAIFGLAGAAVGGVTSLGTAWLTQRAQSHNARIEASRARREALFGDFIAEASRLYGDALSHEKDEVSDLVLLYAQVAKMRLLSSRRTVVAAEQALDVIIETYLGPNRTLHELRGIARNGGMNFLLEFGESARLDLGDTRNERRD